MRVFYWSLLALLTLLIFPLAAGGIVWASGPGMGALPSGSSLASVFIGSDTPAIYAVDPNRPRPMDHPSENDNPIPFFHDALPPTTATEVLASMRPEGRRGQLGERSTRLLPQLPPGWTQGRALFRPQARVA